MFRTSSKIHLQKLEVVHRGRGPWTGGPCFVYIHYKAWEHALWLVNILTLLLPNPTIWFSLDRQLESHKQSRKKMETFWFLRLWSNALMTLLMTPIFDFHKVISAFTSMLMIPTVIPLLVKTSLNNRWTLFTQ